MGKIKNLITSKLSQWSWNESYVWILLILFLLISFQLKISAFNRYIAPSGCDPGNYLSAAYAFLGNDIAGFGLRYPPIFYLLVGLLIKLFDKFVVLKVTAVVVSIIIGIPFFVLARKISDNLISLVCTIFFVFFFEYFGMPAWGGYGNLLGIFFVIFFLLFFWNAVEKTSVRNLILTSFFFALVLGTHVLVLLFAALTVLVFVLFIIALNIRNASLQPLFARFKPLILAGITTLLFSLPFIPSYCLMLQDYPFSTSTNLSAQLQRFVSTSEGVIFCCGALGFFLLLFTFKKRIQVNTSYILMVALFLSPFLLSFVTPTLFSKVVRRVPIFWSIPVLLSVAISLNLAKRHLPKAFYYSLIFSLLIASAVWYIPRSVNHLYRAVDHYQVIKKDELSALSWIKHNTKISDRILCSGSSPERKLGWWVQGLTKRKAFSTEEAYWFKDFTFEREREEAEIASRILSEGDHILENGVIRVADYSFQKNVPNNPIIAVKNVGKYQNLIFINDSSVNLTFSTPVDPQKVYTVSPSHMQNKSIKINQTEEHGRLEYVFRCRQATIKRVVRLEKNANYVDISYKVDLINFTAKRFEVHIRSYLKSAHWETLGNSSIKLGQIIEGKRVDSKISVTQENAQYMGYELDQKTQPQSICYTFNSSKPTFHIKIRISFPSAAPRENKLIEIYNVLDLLKEYSIDYIFIDKTHQRRCMWLRASGHFENVFDTEKVSVFAVGKEGTVD